MTASPPEFCVVIPCLNEEGAIEKTITDVMAGLPAGASEVIVVDDGSTDTTANKLAALASTYTNLVVVRHWRNSGYGASIKSGLRRTDAPFVAITDADGTYPNNRIGEFLEATKNEHLDMVIGLRSGVSEIEPFFHRTMKAVLRRYASWLTGTWIPDMNSGFRTFRASTLKRLLDYLPNGFSFTTTVTMAMLVRHYAVKFIDIDYQKRIGESKLKPLRDTAQFIQLILRTAMYFAPLRVLTPVILFLFALTLTSFLLDVFVLANLTDKTVILFLSSVNATLFALLADMVDKRTSD